MKILYKKNTNGSIQTWQIIVKDNYYYSISGLLNGKLIKNKPTFIEGKNKGRLNETSNIEQTQKEAESKFRRKIESGYFENINEINTKKFFSPMLAKKYVDYKDKIEFPVLVEWKLDGARMVIQKDGLFTRNGKVYLSCPHIHELFKPLFQKYPNWVIDGEIYSHDVPFEKIMSLVRKSKPTEEDLKESEKIIQIYIFDGVIDDVNLGFKERFDLIKQEIIKIIGESKCVKFVDYLEVNSHTEIEKYHNEFTKKGYEGIMIRIPNSIYDNKRSKSLLKYKHFLDTEFEIIDIIEGVGNRSGMAGNLVLKMDDGKTFSSGIRGGEDYYKFLLQNKSKIIGKLSTIRYQELSSDGIPRFHFAINIGRDE